MAPFHDTLLEAIAGQGLASQLRRKKWEREVDRRDKAPRQQVLRVSHQSTSSLSAMEKCHISTQRAGQFPPATSQIPYARPQQPALLSEPAKRRYGVPSAHTLTEDLEAITCRHGFHTRSARVNWGQGFVGGDDRLAARLPRGSLHPCVLVRPRVVVERKKVEMKPVRLVVGEDAGDAIESDEEEDEDDWQDDEEEEDVLDGEKGNDGNDEMVDSLFEIDG